MDGFKNLSVLPMIGIRSYLWNDYRNYWHERWAKKQPPAWCKTCRHSGGFGHRIWMGGTRLPHRHSVLQLWPVNQVKPEVFKTHTLGPRKSRTLIFKNVLAMRRKKRRLKPVVKLSLLIICLSVFVYAFWTEPELIKKVFKKEEVLVPLEISGTYSSKLND